MNTEDYKITMKILRKITDNLIDLSNNHLVDYNDIERAVNLAKTAESILTSNLYRKRNVEIKIKNNNMEMNLQNCDDISNCDNDINKDHSNIINNDDVLEIDTKTKKGKNYNFVKKIVIKLFSKGE